MLVVGYPIAKVVEVTVASLIGMYALSAATVGYWRGLLPYWQRGLLAVGALGLLVPGLITDLIGLAILFIVWFFRPLTRAQAA